ncbi:MAG: T9SS type A sorting domain-containing protein [Paludibacter sp.]|nr:T9SS type A sorting domain-containing protein [Paludibacter sp.]
MKKNGFLYKTGILWMCLFGFTAVYAQIEQMEYFVDNDPGWGNATQLSISPADAIDTDVTLDFSDLTAGLHFLGIRAKTPDGWGITRVKDFYYLNVAADRQITDIEYFIDADPGGGNGIAVSITPDTLIQGVFDISLPNVPAGFHNFCIRARTENGDWGILRINKFFYLKTSASNQITNIEYFVDNDPGQGNGNAVSISPDTLIQGTYDISFPDLSTGFHNFAIRAKTLNGDWGMPRFNKFFYLKTSASNKITNVEYFLDEDPGAGSGTAIPVTPDTLIDANISVDFSALESGLHCFGIRSKTENGDWGPLRTNRFFLYRSSGTDLISGVEYYIDEDPGAGFATAIPVATADSVEAAIDIDVSLLEPGYHTLGIRSQIDGGNWGPTTTQLFYKDDTYTSLIDVKSEDEMILIVYPNPATDYINVKALNVNGNATLEICDNAGKILLTEKYILSNTMLEKLNLSSFQSGNYIIRLQTEKHVKTINVLKK